MRRHPATHQDTPDPHIRTGQRVLIIGKRIVSHYAQRPEAAALRVQGTVMGVVPDCDLRIVVLDAPVEGVAMILALPKELLVISPS